MSRTVTANDGTLAGYFMSHGYTKEEALLEERLHIQAAEEREALYDFMENDPF